MYFCTNFTENTCIKTMLANVVIYWRSCNAVATVDWKRKQRRWWIDDTFHKGNWCTKARFSSSVFYSRGHKHWRHTVAPVSCTCCSNACWTMAMQLRAKKCSEKCFFQTLRYFFSIHIDLDFWIRLGQRPLCITLERNWANGYCMILHWSETAVWSSSMRVQCLGEGKKGWVKSKF